MIDLHYWPTPNGHKITLLLEELVDAGHALEYTIKPVNIGAGDQFKPEYLAISPNNKMPAIVDHAPADGGAPISVFESGAILQYLAEKTGLFLPQEIRARTATEIGSFDTELVEEFWQAVASNAQMNLHLVLHHGTNSHHISEGLFKATARALRQATTIDPRQTGVPSSKGTL